MVLSKKSFDQFDFEQFSNLVIMYLRSSLFFFWNLVILGWLSSMETSSLSLSRKSSKEAVRLRPEVALDLKAALMYRLFSLLTNPGPYCKSSEESESEPESKLAPLPLPLPLPVHFLLLIVSSPMLFRSIEGCLLTAFGSTRIRFVDKALKLSKWSLWEGCRGVTTLSVVILQLLCLPPAAAGSPDGQEEGEGDNGPALELLESDNVATPSTPPSRLLQVPLTDFTERGRCSLLCRLDSEVTSFAFIKNFCNGCIRLHISYLFTTYPTN